METPSSKLEKLATEELAVLPLANWLLPRLFAETPLDPAMKWKLAPELPLLAPLTHSNPLLWSADPLSIAAILPNLALVLLPRVPKMLSP